MKPNYPILILIVFSLLACKHEKNTILSTTKTTLTTTKYDTLSISFNNDEKWISNLETHIGVQNMDSIIGNFDTKDYQNLANNLSKQTSYIIKNCTMKGESHDQLHVVLVPMLEEILILKETTGIEKGEKIITNLKTLILLYFQHFKS